MDPSSSPATSPGRPVRLRRAPRYRTFLSSGAVVGLLVGVVAGLLAGTSGDYGRGTVVGYLAVGGVGVGVLLAGLVAVVIDRRR